MEWRAADTAAALRAAPETTGGLLSIKASLHPLRFLSLLNCIGKQPCAIGLPEALTKTITLCARSSRRARSKTVVSAAARRAAVVSVALHREEHRSSKGESERFQRPISMLSLSRLHSTSPLAPIR